MARVEWTGEFSSSALKGEIVLSRLLTLGARHQTNGCTMEAEGRCWIPSQSLTLVPRSTHFIFTFYFFFSFLFFLFLYLFFFFFNLNFGFLTCLGGDYDQVMAEVCRTLPNGSAVCCRRDCQAECRKGWRRRGNVAAHHRFAFGTRRTFVKSRQAERVPPFLALVLSHDLLEPGNCPHKILLDILHFHSGVDDFSEFKNEPCGDVPPVALRRRPKLRDFVLASKLAWAAVVVGAAAASLNCDWHRRNATSCVHCEPLQMSGCT